MAVTTKKVFPATTDTSTTTFGPIGIELNNQDDLDVYITESGGSRILQYKQSTASTTDSSHPQVNDTTGLYFPPVSSGVTLKNYTLSADNNNIIFNSALPNGAVVTAERRTRDESGDYTAFSAGSTIRSTDLNTAFDEVRFTAQEGRNKAFDLENQLDHRDITVGPGKGIEFEGSTIDGNETRLVVTDPTADRTVTIPDQSGNVIVSGNASIVNADVSPNAEIAVSKLGDGAARQVLQTDSAGTGVEWTSNVDIPGTLDVTSTAAFDSNVTIAGNTTIAGTITVTGTANLAANSIGTAEIANDAVNGSKIADDSIDSEHYVNASIDEVHLNNNIIGSAKIINGAVISTKLGDDSVTTAKIADDAVSNEHIQDNAVRTVHILNSNVTTDKLDGGAVTAAKLATDSVTTAKLADNAVTTAKITNANVTRDKIADDAVNGSKIADDSIGSTHYVNGSIDEVHLNNNIISSAKIINGAVITTKLGDDSVTAAKIADNAVNHEQLASDSVRTAKIQNDAVTIDKIADAAIVTNSEQGSHTANDTTFYTTAASDARYYNIGSLEEIQSGETWAADDAKIATTAAIDARIVDLVDDVGGFVPIANETSFPNANPDVNNGSGTLVSVKALASNLTSNSSGVATISNGTVGNSTVTINGLANSTTYPAGRGMLVETTSTLNTYTFHRQLAEATATTTVANSISNVNTCATNISNINAVAADATDIGVVAGKETEIGRLGTADAVADMNTLATTAIVADLETCADNNANISTTAGAISNVNTVAGAISNVNTTAGAISNVNTTAGAITNVNNVGNNISNVNTVGSNIGTVNDFAARYRGPQTTANEYTSSLDVGDLYFNTTINALKVYNGSAWVAGVTQTGDYALKTGSTYTGNNTHNDGIKSRYGTGNDLEISHDGSNSKILNTTGYLLVSTSSGILYLDGNSTYIRSGDGGEVQAKFIDDGAVELYHDNSKKFETLSNGVRVTGQVDVNGGGLSLEDSRQLLLGTDDDAYIMHNGSHQYNRCSTGYYHIQAQEIRFNKADGSDTLIKAISDGAVELYYDNSKKFETTSTGTSISNGNLRVPDANSSDASYGRIQLGTGQDLQIYHDGSHSIIKNSTGDLQLLGDHIDFWSGDGSERIFESTKDGSVSLFHNGSKKLETSAGGVTVTGNIETNEHISLTGDNKKLKFGAGEDLVIYHDGSNSYIQDDGTGELRIRGTTIRLTDNDGSENFANFVDDGAVELYYDNVKKVETVAGGAVVTGNLGVNLSGSSRHVHIHDTSANTQVLTQYTNATTGTTTNDGLHIGINSSQEAIVQNKEDTNLTIFTGGETCIKCVNDGAVELYYDDAEKLETTSSGINVTGVVVDDGATHDGDVSLNGASYNSWWDKSDNAFKFDDNAKAKFGTGGDLEIYHNGSHSYVYNPGTGNLYIQDNGYVEIGKNTEVMAGFVGDGAVNLYYDNSKKFETSSTGAKFTGWLYADDNAEVRLGNGGDLRLYHNGSNSYIVNSTGDLFLQTTNGKAVYLRPNNGANGIICHPSAGVELFFNGSSQCQTFDGGLNFQDNKKAEFGGSGDLKIYHDGSNSLISETGTGVLKISGSAGVYINKHDNSETCAAFLHDAGVELYYNNVKKFETSAAGGSMHGNLYFDDSGRADFGAGSDLQIYHDGSHSYIKNGTGTLHIAAGSSQSVGFTNNAANAWIVRAIDGGAAELYHNGSKRFETTTNGAIVGGGTYVSELYFNTANGANQRGRIQTTNGNEVVFFNGSNERIWDYDNNGEFAAYYDNSKKLATTSSGINVTGSITVNGSALGSGLFSSYAVLAYVRADGTNSGTFSSGAWRTRGLNTEVSDPDGIVSLSNNQFTLGTGSYLIMWSNSAYRTNRTASRCHNVTDGVTAGRSQEFFAASYDNGSQDSSAWGSGRLSFSGNKVIEIQAYCDTSRGTNGFGVGSPGSNDMYDLVVTIIKES